MVHKFEKLLSIPKSFYVCLKLLGIKKALSLPILVHYNTKIIDLKGCVHILGRPGGGRILMGFGNISEFDKKYERSIIKMNGDITIEAPCKFGQGIRLISERDSELFVGHHFSNTAGLTISNRGRIIIGRNCLVSWRTWICDTDFHEIIDMENGHISSPNGEIIIGNHVWLCANSTVLKGSIIADNTIVAANSLVKGQFKSSNCILAGSPAAIKRYGVNWKG